MEFNEKLQSLRKSRGLTQEELSLALYVSRTAVSKWESGRGYPSIESLKQIAKFFSVTVDELLSGKEALVIAEEETKKRTNGFCNLVFSLLDLSALMFLFLPVFGQSEGDTVSSVSLLQLTEIALWLRVFYYVIIVASAVLGLLTLVFESLEIPHFKESKNAVSLCINTGGVFVFVLSSQVYAAILMFVFSIIKTLVLLKKQ